MAEVKEWVREQLDKGYTLDQIKESLLKAGYDAKLVDDMLKEEISKKGKVSPMPKKLLGFVAIIGFIVGSFAIYFALFPGIIEKNTRIINLEAKITGLESKVAELESRSNLTLDKIIELNPKVAGYRTEHLAVDVCSPYYPSGVSGERLLTYKGEVIGVVGAWPAERGWLPQAEQEQGNPINTSNGSWYTQRIFFKEPPNC